MHVSDPSCTSESSGPTHRLGRSALKQGQQTVQRVSHSQTLCTHTNRPPVSVSYYSSGGFSTDGGKKQGCGPHRPSYVKKSLGFIPGGYLFANSGQHRRPFTLLAFGVADSVVTVRWRMSVWHYMGIDIGLSCEALPTLACLLYSRAQIVQVVVDISTRGDGPAVGILHPG